MATSGSSNFEATRNQIIEQALLDLNVISVGTTISADRMRNSAFRLNAMVKRWQATDIHVWTVAEATLFPQYGQSSYQMGPSATDHVTSSHVTTQLATDHPAGTTSITVDSIVGLSSGMNIGIVVDDGTIHWTTINGAPSGATVILTDALDDSAAEDARVYAYTSKIVRPLRVVSVRRYDVASQRDTPINQLARLDYRSLANKAEVGTVSQAFYDPGLNTGTMFLWYAPQAVNELVNFTWHRPIQDFDTASDNPDLPQEWISTLISNLALELMPQSSVSLAKAKMITQAAAFHLDAMTGFDRESDSIFFQPDTGQ